MSTKWVAFGLSLILILAASLSLMTKGLNLGIDFTGGTVIEIQTENPVNIAPVRAALSNAGLGEVGIQTIGLENELMIRVGKQDGGKEAQDQAVDTIKAVLNKNIVQTIDYRKVDFVGPQVGEELIESGVLALLFSFAAILLYIWIRFEWQFGVGAVAALLHDSFLTLGLFSFLELEFNLTSVAAILTIIGYSINDSVVIFDRIRENLRKYKKKPLPEILNTSINDTLTRTILTAGTTIVALIALVMFGGNVIQGFSIAVLFGVIVGTYSSIYIAAPILDYMKLHNVFGRKADVPADGSAKA
jgi:preprotein translocase SecF subunit